MLDGVDFPHWSWFPVAEGPHAGDINPALAVSRLRRQTAGTADRPGARSAGGVRLASRLALRPRRTNMATLPPYPCIPLSQVADPSQLWDLILEKVTRPEGAVTSSPLLYQGW